MSATIVERFHSIGILSGVLIIFDIIIGNGYFLTSYYGIEYTLNIVIGYSYNEIIESAGSIFLTDQSERGR